MRRKAFVSELQGQLFDPGPPPPKPPQPKLLKYETVHEEKKTVLDLVEQATDPDWAEDALLAIEQVCHAREDFICDDIWKTGLRSTRNDRALGPVLNRAARLGYCVKTNQLRPSLRSHLSGKPVWTSKLKTPILETEGL